MKIEINEQKILTEILERDGSLHEKISEKIENRLIDTVVSRIENKFLKDKSWYNSVEKVIADRVLEDLEEKQTEFVKKILKEFYESYRWKKTDLSILKKLKEFIGEEV